MKWLIAFFAIVSVAGCCNTRGGYPYGYGYPQQPYPPYGGSPYGGTAPYTPPVPGGVYVPPSSTAPSLPPGTVPPITAPPATGPPASAPPYLPPSSAIPGLGTPGAPVTVPPPSTGSIGIPANTFPPATTSGVPSTYQPPRVAPPPAAGASLQPVPSLASPPPTGSNRTTNRNNNTFVPPTEDGDLPSLGVAPMPRANDNWPPRSRLQRSENLAWGARGYSNAGSAQYVAPITYDAPYYSAPVQPYGVRTLPGTTAEVPCCGGTSILSYEGYASPSYTAHGWQPRGTLR